MESGIKALLSFMGTLFQDPAFPGGNFFAHKTGGIRIVLGII
jgi:hypothetical protein